MAYNNGMSFENPTNHPGEDPMVTLAAIEAEIMATGAVDVEPRLIDQIRQELLSGKITSEEAIEKARRVQANRQDYH